MFGGEGSSEMLHIAKRLQDRPVQLIVICGHNRKLAARLRAMPHRRPMFVEGFTRDVPCYMRASDFFIGKPGPGSISEALAMNLPVIIERNAWTLPQERYNAEWVRERGVGLVVGSFRHIGAAVDKLLAPENYRRFRANAAAVENRAVFEIPLILGRILESSGRLQP
jgi:1,2-diacylglycerol 3-beta-galactosyltransferase